MYELASDKGYMLHDLAHEISRQTSKTIPYQGLPKVDYGAALTSLGLPEGLAQAVA
jgi:NAD(P)H dehydrogenase (quinone)